MQNLFKSIVMPSLAALLLFAPVAVGEVLAQDQQADQQKASSPVKKTTETIGTWTLTCATQDEKTRCGLQQQLANKKNKQVVASAIIRIAKDGGAELVLETPTGILLAPGVTIAVDGQEAGKAPFTACAPRGCEASITIDQNLINALAKGKAFSVTVKSIRGKDLSLQFQLDGFTKAYAAFKKGVTN